MRRTSRRKSARISRPLSLSKGRPLGRPQHGGDDAALAVEYQDRLEAVVVVIGAEQPQLLAAVHGVERVIDVEHDPLRHLPERPAIEIDHGMAHPQQGPSVRQVLQA